MHETQVHDDNRACMAADDDDVLSELTNKEAATEDGAASRLAEGDVAEVVGLRARIRQLELQQSLMDSELESMSDLAKQSDAQLRQGHCRTTLLTLLIPSKCIQHKQHGLPFRMTTICKAIMRGLACDWGPLSQSCCLGRGHAAL